MEIKNRNLKLKMENEKLESVEVSVYESYTTYIRKKQLVINITDYIY